MKRAFRLIKIWFSILIFFLAVIFFFLTPSLVFAAFSFTIDSVSATSISSKDQEIEVSLSITDLPSESYFRTAVQKESGGSYFGYVKNNNGEWAKIQALSGDCSSYYKVTDTTTTSLMLKFKLGDEEIESGDYKLKAHRFTSTCNSYTEATNSHSLTISLPTPTPTPTTEPTNTPTPTITNTPTPTKTPTPTPVKTPTATPTTKPKSNSPTPTKTLAPTAVLGEKTIIDTPTPTISSKPQGSNGDNLAKILIGLGIVFIGACGILAFRAYKEGKGVGL